MNDKKLFELGKCLPDGFYVKMWGQKGPLSIVSDDYCISYAIPENELEIELHEACAKIGRKLIKNDII